MGSFNFTKVAEEKNAEDLLLIHGKKLAVVHTKNRKENEGHLEVYYGR